jgi:hypothetical protein
MGKAERHIKLFIESMELSAIWIASDGAGRCRMGVSRDPARRVSKIAGASLAALWWCDDYRHAMLVVAQCQVEMKRRAMLTAAADWFEMQAADAEQQLLIVAEREQVDIQSDNSIRERAIGIVAKIDISLQAMRTAGALKNVNRSYREYRIALEAQGKRALNYNLWFLIWKRNLIRAIAKTANHGCAISERDIGKAMSHLACPTMSSEINIPNAINGINPIIT